MFDEIEAAGSNLREVVKAQREAETKSKRKYIPEEKLEEILHMIAEGKGNTEIAKIYDISPNYVYILKVKHKVRIMEMQGLNIDGTTIRKKEEAVEDKKTLPETPAKSYTEKERLRRMNAAIEWADAESTYQCAYGDEDAGNRIDEMRQEMMRIRNDLFDHMVDWDEVAK